MVSGLSTNKMQSKRYIVCLLSLGLFLCIVGVALIITVPLLLAKCEKENTSDYTGQTGVTDNPGNRQCAPSNEATRVKLNDTIAWIMTTFYSLYPNKVVWHPHFVGEDLKRFRPYNCSPSALKQRTDTVMALYKEAAKFKKSINQTLLKPRELKALFQLLHYLKTNFGMPYGENYYAGDWMMGPSRFCQELICYIGDDLYYHFNLQPWSWQPKTTQDVVYIMEQLKSYRSLINQYIKNIEYGIKAGMVRSYEDCMAGYYSFTSHFFKIYTNGYTGILQEWFTKTLTEDEFLSGLDDGVQTKWFKDTGKTIREHINTTLIEYVGRPLNKLLDFLKNKHRVHCVPSNISSGLATLPLEYVYKNGTRTSTRTTKKLPFGETVSGKKAYQSILHYYTTNDLTPEEIHLIGKERLHTLYSEAKQLAIDYTHGRTENESVVIFKQILVNQSNYFNDAPFPTNESSDEAFKKCDGLPNAKLFCPKRYEAFQKWTSFVREILSKLEPKLIDMFYFTGNKRTTPSCPVEVVPNFNPKTGSQSYRSTGSSCWQRPSHYRLPFFMDNFGPKYSAFSVAGHEGRPGHHTQVQGNAENFYNPCRDEITWLGKQVNYPLFTEGWALYAENPLLAQGTDIYDDDQIQKYGMLKWQIWRALRLVVDTGLHYKGMKRSEALEYHAQYAWDTTDKATKDVTRYQSNPGQAVAYMIGQQEIWKLRNYTKEKLEAANKSFNEKEFHYQILSQGQSPIEYLKTHIDSYIDCVINDCKNLPDDVTSRDSNGQFLKRERRKNIIFSVFSASWNEHFD